MPKVTCARIMASLIVGAMLLGFGSSIVISQWMESIPFALLGCGLAILGFVFLLKPCIDTHCQRNIDDHGPNCKCAESTKGRKRAAAAKRCSARPNGNSACAGSSCSKQSRPRSVDTNATPHGKQPSTSLGRDSPNPNEENMINSRLDMMAISAKFGLRTRLETLPEEDSSNLDLSEQSPQDDNEITMEEEEQPPPPPQQQQQPNSNKFVPTSV